MSRIWVETLVRGIVRRSLPPVAVAVEFPRLAVVLKHETQQHFQFIPEDGVLDGDERLHAAIQVPAHLLWVAALLTPRPPPLMVLNEPETSLHPDLLPALARLIIQASRHTQVWVVSHADRLIHELDEAARCERIDLEKELGETRIRDQGPLEGPSWRWPDG